MEKKRLKKKSSFLNQAAILATAGIVVRLIGFLYRPALTGLIGDRGNAIYAAGFQIYNFLLILSSAGLPPAIGRLVSERIALKEYGNAHRVFKVSLLFSAIAGFVCMAILIVSARFFAEKICKIDDAYYTLLSLAPTLFIVAVMSSIRGYFQGMNTMIPTAISQIVEQIFNATASIGLAYILVKRSVALGAAGGTMGTGVGALFGLLVLIVVYRLSRPTIKKQIKRSRGYEKKETNAYVLNLLIGTAFPIILGTAVYSLTNLVDLSMVMDRLLYTGAFTQARAEELYGQLQGKYVLLSTFPVALTTAMATAAIPDIAGSLALGDRSSINKKINIAVKISMIISIPSAVGMGILANQLILLLFPSAPEGGKLVLAGSVSIIFLALSQIATGILQGIGDVKTPAINAVFGTIVKIVLNYFLIAIPFINVVGAIIATTGCYIVSSTLNLRRLIRLTGVRLNYKDIITKPSICAFVMGIVCFTSYNALYGYLKSNTIATIIVILISMVVYFIGIILIGAINREDLAYIPFGGRLKRVFKILRR